MQPALPQKPLHSVQTNQRQPTVQRQLHSELSKLNITHTDHSNRTDLPFKIISPDHTLELFKTKHKDNLLLQVPLPSYFEYISNAKIKEFIDNDELVSGYVNMLYNEDFTEIKEELDIIIQSQHDTALDLKNKYTESKDGLLSKAKKLDKDLVNYHSRLNEFDHLQIEMYDSLSDLSRQNISKLFDKKVSETESLYSDILRDASEKEGKLDPVELEKLLDDYILLRHKWHNYKECISKIDHHKVIGLE